LNRDRLLGLIRLQAEQELRHGVRFWVDPTLAVALSAAMEGPRFGPIPGGPAARPASGVTNRPAMPAQRPAGRAAPKPPLPLHEAS